MITYIEILKVIFVKNLHNLLVQMNKKLLEDRAKWISNGRLEVVKYLLPHKLAAYLCIFMDLIYKHRLSIMNTSLKMYYIMCSSTKNKTNFSQEEIDK